MMTPVLQAAGLHKRFGGVAAVRGVDLAVRPGEVVALIGPNGAGKSTCFNLLMGQLRPDAGRVTIGGTDVTGWPPRRIWRQGVGRTFQITQILPSFTVRENVQLARLSHRRRLFDLWRRACGLLAYGDLKRVELAVPLAHDPRLLLMDEPTAGMAPAERQALMQLTREIARRKGVAVLFTEHDMDVVFAHADRIMVMSRGRLIKEGAPDEVRQDPLVRALYLGTSDA